MMREEAKRECHILVKALEDLRALNSRCLRKVPKKLFRIHVVMRDGELGCNYT